MSIVKISAVIAVLGLVSLWFITDVSGDMNVPLYDLSSYMGKTITTSGNVESVYTTKDGHTFIKITDDITEIKVVAFKGSVDNAYAIEQGQDIEVRGKVDEYKGFVEIIAQEIMIL
jgi:DNA/RNA endonuclease YhcR with UshA esterase domain